VAAGLALLRQEGYLEVPGFLPPVEAGRMDGAVRKLVGGGWQPVFAMVYDEFWDAVASLAPVLAGILGDDYRQLPDFWAWHVNASDVDRGWSPHRDRPGTVLPDGTPATLTVWFALSEATPLNGCIYMMPMQRDALFHSTATATVPLNQLQNIRALPVRAGSVLAWNQQVFHWGARSSSRADGPRVSFACEFQRGDIPPCNTPLLIPVMRPDFQTRLRLIGMQVLQYQHMYKLSAQLCEVARRLTGR
jgi:hypothetical protein